MSGGSASDAVVSLDELRLAIKLVHQAGNAAVFVDDVTVVVERQIARLQNANCAPNAISWWRHRSIDTRRRRSLVLTGPVGDGPSSVSLSRTSAASHQCRAARRERCRCDDANRWQSKSSDSAAPGRARRRRGNVSTWSAPCRKSCQTPRAMRRRDQSDCRHCKHA